MQLWPIIKQIEELAANRAFGQLPTLRSRLKNLRRTHKQIFYLVRSVQTPKANWSYAFHRGGRHELQFNVGLEDVGKTFRYGVAFSFQRSRNLTDLTVLRRSFDRFNDFVRGNPEYLSRFLMWTYGPRQDRSERLPVKQIPEELFRWGVFVFVGSTQPASARSIDYGLILNDLDWLIPVYEFVEGKGKTLTVTESTSRFEFQNGCSIRTFSTSASVRSGTIEIDLRQNQIQEALFRCLASRFGQKNVRTEWRITNRSVDIAVRNGCRLWYYEVKTSQSARQCIREALGQLLEYSYWPGFREADRLIIVGEGAPSSDSRKYIALLRKRFKIPLEYNQFELSSGQLVSS